MKPSKIKGYKPKTKAPLSTTDRSQRLFTSLCAQIDGGHFKNAVKTCDKSMFAFRLLPFSHKDLSPMFGFFGQGCSPSENVFAAANRKICGSIKSSRHDGISGQV